MLQCLQLLAVTPPSGKEWCQDFCSSSFSELGDKTFFIALLLALKQSQGLVFVGTFGALGIMTVISVGTPLGLPNVCYILQFLDKVQCRGVGRWPLQGPND